MEISTLAARTLAVVVASSDKNNELFFSLPNGEPEILTFGNKWKIKQGQRRSNYQLRIRREQVSCAFFTVLLQGDGGAFLCLVFARNEWSTICILRKEERKMTTDAAFKTPHFNLSCAEVRSVGYSIFQLISEYTFFVIMGSFQDGG